MPVSYTHLDVYQRQAQAGVLTMDKKKVAFICVHDSCRSQMAEALGKHLAADKFDFYSAGTETKSRINQDAERLMKQLYGIDMEQSQYSKTIDKIPTPDIEMGIRDSAQTARRYAFRPY